MSSGFLPDDQTLQLSARVRIDKVCLAFEDAWKAGRAPPIEDLLVSAAGHERTELFHQLLVLELEYRVKRGERAKRSEYEARFPDLTPVVAHAFDQLGAAVGSTNRRGLADTIDPQSDASRPSATYSQGQKIGRYLVKRWLGGGAFGAVYLALDEDLGRLVAIKVPRFDHLDNEELLEGFIKEARTVAKLKHPGIVPIYDVGRTPQGRLFVVMEYMEGRTLKDLLDTERVSPTKAAELLIEIADAVGYAHRQGIVHRDLKPANILLDELGRPRVVDFGLAVHESDQRRRAGEYAGTLPYMSPEQVRGETHRLDGRADIWALGVILYQMMSGRIPFSGDSIDQVSDEILHREAKPLRQIDAQIPASLERIWQKCCAKQIADRYSTAADLADDLRRFLEPQQIEPHVAAPVVAAARSQPWQPVIVIGGAVCVVGVAVVALVVGVFFANRAGTTPVPAHVVANNDSTGKPLPVVAGPKVPLECQLDVLIWNPADLNRRSLAMRAPGALPLQAGDLIRVQARLNRPLYLYLVWIDSEGVATPFHPWPIGRWNELPKVTAPTSDLALPAKTDEGWPISGPAGMETLVLLARDEPLPPDVNLAALFASLSKQEMQDPRSVVWFADGQTLTEQLDMKRGPNFFDPRKLNDPVLQTQRELGERLAPHFTVVRAVSFAKQGR